MLSKRIVQSLVLTALVVGMLATTGSAYAYSCGSSYTVQRGDWLYSIARKCGTTLYALMRANPGLDVIIYPGQVLILPGAYWDNGNGYGTYVVGVGDTLRSLADRYGTSVDTLVALNGIANANVIYEGQRLIVPNGAAVPIPPTDTPPSAGGTYVVQWGDTMRKIASRYNTTVDALLSVNPQIWNANLIYVGQVINLPSNTPTYYTVQAGDTMRLIAERYGTTVDTLIALNPQIPNVNWIYVGQVVRVW
jgi:LysM repeat protein